jgi:hypothetical protein
VQKNISSSGNGNFVKIVVASSALWAPEWVFSAVLIRSESRTKRFAHRCQTLLLIVGPVPNQMKQSNIWIKTESQSWLKDRLGVTALIDHEFGFGWGVSIE